MRCHAISLRLDELCIKVEAVEKVIFGLSCLSRPVEHADS